MGEKGGKKKAEARHKNFFHDYTITVISVIICAESPSLSDQDLALKPNLKSKSSSWFLPLERANPAHKPQMHPKCLSL